MLKHPLVISAVLAAALIVTRPAAAAEGQAKKEGEKNPPAQNVGGVVDAKGAATVTGVVRFKGTKPEPKPIPEIAGNAFCKEHHREKVPVKDNFVFGKNGDDDTLVNVLVYVSKGLEGKTFEPPKEKAVLDQVDCVYVPHVVAVMAGQTLEVRNSDATLHNVMAQPRNNPAFNFGMPVKDQVVEKVFKESEFKLNTKCFMHPWMSAYVHVLPHPYFAVTQADGTFTIRGLPPGEYEVTVLHEASLFEPTPATATVKVAADETKNVDFVYQPRGEKK